MYENVTYEEILQRMLDRVSSRFDKREGSVIWDTHSPTAIEFQILYIELDNILKEAYGDTASREYLILRCAERGISPYGASHAILRGEFSPVELDVTGQRFNIEELNYVVIEKIEDGIYQVQCETAGAVGNQYLGSMVPIDYIAGLETAELTAVLIPGEDEEGTEELRARYFSSFDAQAFGGNRADYLEKVNAIAGVGSAKVTRVWNSNISPADMIPSEMIKSWYQAVIGSLEGEVRSWLTSVYIAAADKKLTTGGTVLLTILDSEYNTASDALINLVQKTLDPEEYAGEGYGLAPIGHVVTVKGADSVVVEVTTTITFYRGYTWSNLQSQIRKVVEAYLLELRKTWSESEYLIVRISQIESRLLNITGIADITDTAINGIAKNLVLGEYEVPILGGVSPW